MPDGDAFYSVGNDKLIKRWSMNNYETPTMTIVGKVNSHIEYFKKKICFFSMFLRQLIIIIKILNMLLVVKMYPYGMNNVHNLFNHSNGVQIVMRE